MGPLDDNVDYRTEALTPTRLVLAAASLLLLRSASPAAQEIDPAQITDLYAYNVKVAEETIRKVPGFAKPLLDLGQVHQRFQFDDRAMEAYLQGLRMNPRDYGFHARIGFILSQTNHIDDALKYFREGLRLYPEAPDLHHRIGLILMHEKGKLAEAVEEFRLEIQNRTASPTTYTLLGHTLRDLGKFPEAIRSFREALRMNPEETGACYGLSQVYKLMGDRGEEQKALERYEKLKVKDDEVLREGTKKGGNRDEQLHLTSVTHLDAAQTYLLKDMKEDAEGALRAAIQFNPSQFAVHRMLIEILLKEKKADEAFIESQKLLAKSREEANLFQAAGLYTERRLFEDAGRLLEEAALKEPKEGDVYRELARLILGKRIPGDLARATELARKALERSPGEAKNYDVYAWALMQGGNRTAAQDSLEIASRLSPDDEQIRRRLEDLRGKRP